MAHQKQQGAFYERAPDILLEKIAELSAVLVKNKNKEHSAEKIKFYEAVLNAMKIAHFYMQETKWIHARNNILENNIRYLSLYNKEIREKLNEYETVEKLKLEGRLEEVAENTR